MIELLICIALICRFTLIVTFSFSFLGKVRNIPKFAQTIRDFDILPPFVSQLGAWAFLVGELAALLCLLLDSGMLKIGLILAAILLSVFSVALAITISRHARVYCNCFGNSDHIVSQADILRNVGLLTCAALGLLIITVFGEVPSISLIVVIATGSAAVLFTAFLLSMRDIAIFLSRFKTEV